MKFYQRHLGDYARDTAHLSLLEHGVYSVLLDRARIFFIVRRQLDQCSCQQRDSPHERETPEGAAVGGSSMGRQGYANA
jgi:hypothetical protein